MSPATTSQAGTACSLNKDSLSERLARIALLAQRHLLSERQEGETLHLTYAQEAGPELQRILELERQCCPFLVFELTEGGCVIQLAILAKNMDEFTTLLYEHFRGVAPSNTKRACAGRGCGCLA